MTRSRSNLGDGELAHLSIKGPGPPAHLGPGRQTHWVVDARRSNAKDLLAEDARDGDRRDENERHDPEERPAHKARCRQTLHETQTTGRDVTPSTETSTEANVIGPRGRAEAGRHDGRPLSCQVPAESTH
jgi:hypothetical protein